MEASTLTRAGRGGLLGRRSPLLKLQGDERLVSLIRDGNDHAFEALFQRYHSRLLAFCRHMLRSTEDAEDVLQEVFVKAHAAMLGDARRINVRPWLYRIARNRCLNHLRRPMPEGQDSMDVLVGEGGVTTAERVQTREAFRQLVADVGDLPETQRTALLLREIDALCYEEIAETMDTTVPAVKSLLVRARMSLAEATQSRQLTCGEVRLELAEAAEGLRKASGPVRHHVKGCDPCREYRTELRSNARTLAGLAPLGPLALLHKLIVGKLGGSGTAAGGSAAGTAGAGGAAVAGGGATGAGGVAAGTAAVAAGGGAGGGVGGAAIGAAAGAGGIGGAIGAKAAATAATAALLTAGAVEVRHIYSDVPESAGRAPAAARSAPPVEASGNTKGEAEVTFVQRSDMQTGEAAPTSTSEQPATEEPPAAPETTEESPQPQQPVSHEAVAPEPAAAEPAVGDQLEDGVVGPAGSDEGTGAGASSAVVIDPSPTPSQPAPVPTPAPAPSPTDDTATLEPVPIEPAAAPAETTAPAEAVAPAESTEPAADPAASAPAS